MPVELPLTNEDLPHSTDQWTRIKQQYEAIEPGISKTRDILIMALKPLYWLLQAANHRTSKIFFMKVPVLFLLNISLFIILLIRFIPNYSRLYAQNGLTTTLMSNLLLFGLADCLAQTLTLVFTRPRTVSVDTISTDRSDAILHHSLPTAPVQSAYSDEPREFLIFVDYGDDIHDEEDEVDNRSAPNIPSSVNIERHVTIFDYPRLVGFMLWGFIISFFQFTWYKILNGLYVDDPKFITVLERVLADQLCYSPISLAAFFYYSSIVLEHGDKYTFEKKIKKIYIGTLAANYSVWPAVQFINFLVMPKQYQVPFSSSVGVLWNCFLSIRNAQSADDT